MSASRAAVPVEPIVSYAQNHEDILLWRAFKDVKDGFYVDVGANSPNDSLTALFYERGWHGINVEPVPSWFQLLQDQRPRDINLNICISDSEESVDLIEVVDTGLTTSDAVTAESFADTWETRKIRCAARTLADVLDEFAPPDIHFLSIDVEGMEARVIAGADLRVHRPRIIIVESIHPVTHEPTHEAWEPDLRDAGYQHLFFDGVNRFYGAEEWGEELSVHFSAPPNSTDCFTTRTERDERRLARERGDALHELSQHHHEIRVELDETHARLSAEIARAGALHAQVNELESRARHAELCLDELTNSMSWRITAPLRTVLGVLRRGLGRVLRR